VTNRLRGATRAPPGSRWLRNATYDDQAGALALPPTATATLADDRVLIPGDHDLCVRG
jgi:hypothetical protein